MSKKEQIFFFILLAFFDNQQVITKQNEKYTHSKYNTPKQKSHINIKSTFIHRHCKVHFENWQYGKNNQFQQANTFNQKELLYCVLFFSSESFPYMRNQHQNWYNNADCRPYFDYQFKFSVKVVRQGSNIIKGNQQIKDKIYWKEFVYPFVGGSQYIIFSICI